MPKKVVKKVANAQVPSDISHNVNKPSKILANRAFYAHSINQMSKGLTKDIERSKIVYEEQLKCAINYAEKYEDISI